jgi:PAS domain S-box-containing protein
VASHNGSRTFGLQALLAALPALAVLPVVAFALLLLYLLWEGRQDETRRELAQTVGTLAVAVGSEIEGSTRELRRLAELPSLDADRLAEFHRYAATLVSRNEGWDNITVVDTEGTLLVDAARPFGIAGPRIDSAHLRRVIETGRSMVSDLHASPIDGRPSVVVSVPVVREGRAVWVLSARLAPDRLSQFIGKQLLREGSLAALIDRNLTVIARSREAERFVGHRVTPDLEAALAGNAAHGERRLVTLDGASVLAAWQHTPQGWTVTIGVPVALYDAPLQRSIAVLVAFGTLVLALGVALSLMLGRRISAAIGSVGIDARALADGAPIAPRRSRIAQVDALFHALRDASRMQRENTVARERALEALRASEQRLQLAIDATEAGTYDWDLATDRIAWSPRTRELFGVATDAPIRARTFFDSVHPEDLASVRAGIESALAGADGGRIRMEYRVLRADGRSCWLDARGQVHFGTVVGPRTPVRLVGVVVDQTERRQHIEALHEADRRKDEFLAMLAHELRNPLAPLRNAVGLLARTVPAGTTASRAVAMSERQVRHMTRLVNDLLDVSRITQGKIELRREPVEIADVVVEAIEAIRPMVELRSQKLAVVLPGHSPVVLADTVRIAQVLENLLSNASKYTDTGGSIDLQVSEEGDDVLLRVSDTGIGIDRDHLAKVFDLFLQIDATAARTEGGLGIGLSLVKRLVELHGGRVTAYSDGPGRGTCFEVRLPRHATALAA